MNPDWASVESTAPPRPPRPMAALPVVVLVLVLAARGQATADLTTCWVCGCPEGSPDPLLAQCDGNCKGEGPHILNTIITNTKFQITNTETTPRAC